jgi:hypothetical protein
MTKTANRKTVTVSRDMHKCLLYVSKRCHFTAQSVIDEAIELWMVKHAFTPRCIIQTKKRRSL